MSFSWAAVYRISCETEEVDDLVLEGSLVMVEEERKESSSVEEARSD